MVSLQLIGLGLAALLLAVSVSQFWVGVRAYRAGSAVASAVSLADSTRPGELVFVEGVVDGAVDGRTIASPMGGTDCVAYASRKVKQKAYGEAEINESLGGAYRERIRERQGITPFVLDTGTTQVTVAATDGRVDVPGEKYEPVSVGQVRQNRGLLAGLWRLGRELATHADEQVRRRYLEACFRAGDPVRVVGARGRDGEPTIREPGAAPLVVSTKPQSAIAGGFRSTGRERLFGGVVLLVVAGGVLFVTVSAV